MNSNHCVYMNHMILVMIALWVDDLMIFAKDKVTINDVKSKLNESFDMKDLGELEYFLGIRMNQDQTKNMIKIDQESYVEKILQVQGMQNCKSLTMPLDPGMKSHRNKLELDDIEKHNGIISNWFTNVCNACNMT